MVKNTNYTSDPMNFINELVKKKPELQEKRETLRKTWWDKDDSEVTEDRNLEETNLKLHGYAYYSYEKPK